MFLSIEIEHNPTTVVFPIRGTATDFDQLTDIPFPVNGRWDDVPNDSVLVQNLRLFNQRINSNWARIYFQKQ